MSGYGWLTQSALMPKKSKPIKVDDEGSLFSLKAVLSRERQKITTGGSRKIYEVKRTQSKNSGVEERAKKDETEKVGSRIHDGAKMLQIKQKIYDSLETSKQNVGKLLVDFSAKSLFQNDNNEYEKVREQFYSGKLQEIQNQREQISGDDVGERDLRERLAWERQIIGKLKGDIDEREKVQQVFDRRMHGDQKTALEEVRKEFGEEGKMLEDVKKRREQLQNQRIRKLMKLNILVGSRDESVAKETTPEKQQGKDASKEE